MSRQVEFGLSTSMIQGDLDRLPLLRTYPATHVEIGFVRADRLDVVLDYVKDIGSTYGFHDPLPWHPRWRWPSLTDPDKAEQARSLGVAAHTLESVTAHGAHYGLVHFPSVHFEPVDGWTRERALEAGHEAAATLARWADERGTPVLLENVGPNPYWDADAWIEILETYPPLYFCLDVGHLHLETAGHHEANLAFAEALAPFTRQIHLYNATPEAYRKYHHVPVHPDHRPEDGWIDVEAMLAAVMGRRKGPLRIVFEHTPEYPAETDWILEGMDWVRSLANGQAS